MSQAAVTVTIIDHHSTVYILQQVITVEGERPDIFTNLVFASSPGSTVSLFSSSFSLLPLCGRALEHFVRIPRRARLADGSYLKLPLP
jgi:hypothetical protein